MLKKIDCVMIQAEDVQAAKASVVTMIQYDHPSCPHEALALLSSSKGGQQ